MLSNANTKFVPSLISGLSESYHCRNARGQRESAIIEMERMLLLVPAYYWDEVRCFFVTDLNKIREPEKSLVRDNFNFLYVDFTFWATVMLGSIALAYNILHCAF